MKMTKRTLVVCLAAIITALTVTAGADPSGKGVVYSLDQFGPIGSPSDADATLQKASAAIIAQGGGVLVIPKEAPAAWRPENTSQGIWRKPAPPAPAETWGATPGITILDDRTGTLTVYVPQMTGLQIERTLRLPEGQSSPHWDYHPMLRFHNSIVRGSTSFRDWVTQDVKAGKDQRFYVKTIRGIFPGMFLSTGDQNVSRIYVKSIGWDTDKQAPYFVADVDRDLSVKQLLPHNKTHTNVLRMDTYAHTENQTFDVLNWRHHYSQGDAYMYHAYFDYMGDVHSTAGDENGVVYAAMVQSEINHFRGMVESWDPQTQELKYKAAAYAHTLGTGRPLINLNPKKWITEGSVVIVRPRTWWDLADPRGRDPVFAGKTYPTRLVKDAATGQGELRMGGLIRFSADALIAEDVVGRYFAVNEPDELVPDAGTPGEIRRWYLIHSVKKNADGTTDIQIVRHWWGAKPAGAPTLYNPDNYSSDAKVKPLRCIIAPGANVYDVARGVKDGPEYSSGALERIIRLAPGPHVGTALDFAGNDPVEQAVGPDPFKPIPFRSWVFEKVPGAWPAPIFDIANNGDVSRHAVMTVGGGTGNLDERATRVDKRPPWENVIQVNSAVANGIVFNADVQEAAMLFMQPHNRPQAIKWLYADGKKEASWTVSPTDGTMTFDGGGLSAPDGLANVRGVSGSDTKARNLRGINVPIPAGAKEFAVKFPKPEADAEYAVFLELTWLSDRAITRQTPDGFTVLFQTPPAAEGKLHWLLLR